MRNYILKDGQPVPEPDILAFASNRLTVTNSGDAPSSGTIAGIFNPGNSPSLDLHFC